MFYNLTRVLGCVCVHFSNMVDFVTRCFVAPRKYPDIFPRVFIDFCFSCHEVTYRERGYLYFKSQVESLAFHMARSHGLGLVVGSPNISMGRTHTGEHMIFRGTMNFCYHGVAIGPKLIQIRQ